VETGSGEGKAVSADRGASARLVPADVPAALVAGAVLVSGHALLRDDTAPAARAALEAAEAPYVAVVAAAGGLVGGDFHERARGANVVLANEAEAEALTGLRLREAALVLGELYDLAVVTAGPAGAVAAADGGLAVAGPSRCRLRGARLAGRAWIFRHLSLPPWPGAVRSRCRVRQRPALRPAVLLAPALRACLKALPSEAAPITASVLPDYRESCAGVRKKHRLRPHT